MASSTQTIKEQIHAELDRLGEEQLLAVLEFAQSLGGPQTGKEYLAGLDRLAEENGVTPEEAEEFWRCMQDGRAEA
jgi:hypothetical protein